MGKFKSHINKILIVFISLLLIYSVFVADKFIGLNEAQAQVRKKTTKKSTAKKSTTKKSARAGSTTKKSTAKKSTAKKSTTKKSARAGSTTKKSTAKKSTTKKSARAGSTTKKSTAKKSTTKKSARAGTTTVNRAGNSSSSKSSARAGTTVRVAGGSSRSSTGSFTAAPKVTGTYTATGAVGNSNKAQCIYAYVNCMDALIGYALNKNPFLGADKTVKNLVGTDKPFRCIFAGANYSKYQPAPMEGHNFIPETGKYSLGKIKVQEKDLLGKVTGETEQEVSDYMATAIYKKYNYFCEESDIRNCNYSAEGHSSYMATEKSIAYYMDVISRIRGGCSNGFVDWPTDEEGETDTSQLKDLEKECKASGGRWNEPNSLKMVDMSANIMSDLGANQKGKCYTNDTMDQCVSKGRTWVESLNKCQADLTATLCQSTEGATWEIEKEWTFAINTPPPSMTLDAGEEFAWASGACFTGVDFKDANMVKSKRLKEIEKALTQKGISEDIVTDLINKGPDGEDPYIDILVECADVKDNLEQYYMTGVWKEDCTTAADPNKCTPETTDENFVTPYKSCLQYEEALKAARVDWKGQATEAIAENGRELERKMKEEEAKALQSDLKTNLTVANMANEVFKQCLIGDKNSQGFKGCAEAICGNGYVDCVSPAQGGIVTSKLLEVGTTCYPSYKICMDTVAKTLNVNNMSPQLKSIVLDIQQDPVKMQDLAMETIKESLGEEYQNALEKTCEEAGGWFEDGVCAAGIMLKTNITAEFKKAAAEASSGGSGKDAWSSSSKSSGGSSFSSMMSKTGLILPGVNLTCKSSGTASSSNSASGDGTSSASATINGDGFSATCSTSADANASSNGQSSASSSCVISNSEARMLTKDGDSFEEADKCGGMFIPKGWEAVIGKAGCIDSNSRIKLPTAGNESNPWQMAIDIFKGKDVCKPKGHVTDQFEKQILTKWRDIFKKEDEKSK